MSYSNIIIYTKKKKHDIHNKNIKKCIESISKRCNILRNGDFHYSTIIIIILY